MSVNQNQGEITYIVVVFPIGDQFNAMVPDFTLFASGKSRDEVLANARSVTEEAISVYKQRGNKLPTPTSANVIASRWDGGDAELVSVIFSV